MADTDNVSEKITVNECIRLFPDTIGVFTKFNIDSRCGGAVSIEEAAGRDGAPLPELMEELNKAAL